MDGKKGTILGAAGAVAAATAVGVAMARRKGREPEVWHVRPAGDGWAVSLDGNESPRSTHGTKKEAVSAGRTVARDRAPSTMVLHYADGTIQKRVSYDRDG